MRLPFLAAAAFLLAACASSSTAPRSRVATMDVAPQRVACMGPWPMECLSVREHPDTTWTLFYGHIEGFEFEPGFEYTIRLSITPVPNPPADGSSMAYSLLSVLSKVPAS